jgi:hypothetical protein
MKILEDYETEAEHAKRFDVDVRTLRRWRNLPNGLPYTKAGCTVLYRLDWTEHWLESHKTQRNPEQSRRGRRAA